MLYCILFLILSSLWIPPDSSTLRIAVASNFAPTLQEIALQFTQETGYPVILIPGSTGKLYAQIQHHAPFDAFFAADTLHPYLLETHHRTVPGTRFTYARGVLVLWSPEAIETPAGAQMLTHPKVQRIALANPRFAPYGIAAREVLQRLNLWNRLKARLIMGQNISQVFHFVYSRNASVGFIARAFLHRLPPHQQGTWWEIPDSLYAPLWQQAVLLKDSLAGRLFFQFVQQKHIQQFIRNQGYYLP